ncbi:MAG: hypothetical protein B7Z80_27475 [Rhodospirillales bacterium 20-64-7]|nr:MAG: hypothetical protein B7Z80_27475 [Rhodospirillales bacterium 20-64-7]
MNMPKTPPPILFGLLILASCHAPPTALLGAPATPIALSRPYGAAPSPRISSAVAGGVGLGASRPSASLGAPAPATASGPAAQTGDTGGPGDVSFDFADTDIRAVVAQILGGMLHVNYTIDPGVSGTVTLHTVTPLTRAQVLPTLQTLLAQSGAVLVQTDGLYRVMPASEGGGAAADTQVITLRYANAAELAAVLQPYVAKGARLTADGRSNAIVVQGDPASRAALAGLVQAFDVDALAGQSYELFPVASGDAKDFAEALSAALAKQADAKGAAAVTVVPLARISAVLVIARAPAYLENAARIYAVVSRVQRETVRSWHVFYLRNSRANDAAYLLQEAFTPGNVTAQPSTAAQTSVSAMNGNGGTGASSGTPSGSLAGTGAGNSASANGLANTLSENGGVSAANTANANTGSASALEACSMR